MATTITGSDQKSTTVLFQLCTNLRKCWNRKPPNLDECEKLLEKLKVTLVECQIDFLPTQDSIINGQQIVTARDTLEIGAQWAIAKKDKDLFERYMAQLKCYYLDYKVDELHGDKHVGVEESAYKAQLLGLNLLRLLSENKLADFHTELELLKSENLKNSIYIKHPVQIEQYMMEGSYNKIFLGRENLPAADYSFFMDILLETIRKEIVQCIEKAYEKLEISEAARMLFLESKGAMISYAQSRNWSVVDNMFTFQREERVDDTIPAADLAEKTIEYARELEMIV